MKLPVYAMLPNMSTVNTRTTRVIALDNFALSLQFDVKEM